MSETTAAPGGLLVGSIYAKLGAFFDPAGFEKQEAAARRAIEQARKPVEARLGAHHNPSGFKLFSGSIGKAERETISMREHVGKLTFGLSGLASGMAGLAAGFGVFELLKKGTERLGEVESTAARTTAQLKATSGASHETAKGIEDLAKQIEAKTGIDREQAHAGENVLLAYRNVRNEVGLHHDVYTQAAKAAADLSAAMPGRDMAATAKMVGIALNDPAVGLTRLSRAGIQFSAQQKEQIKNLLAEGKLYQAQELILGELEKRYGGVADQVGKTTPAALSRAKVGFEEVASTIAGKAAPTIRSIGNGLAALAEQLQHNTGFGGFLIRIWNGIEHAAGSLASGVEKVVDMFKSSTSEGETLRGVLGGIVGALIGFKAAEAAASAIGVLGKAFTVLAEMNPLVLALGAFAGLLVYLDTTGIKFKNLRDFLEQVWHRVEDQAKHAINAVKGFIDTHRKDLESMGRAVQSIGRSFVYLGERVLDFVQGSHVLGIVADALVKIATLALAVTAGILKLVATGPGLAVLGALVGALTGRMVALFAAMLVDQIETMALKLLYAADAVKALTIAIAENPLGLFLVVVGAVAGALLGLSSNTKKAKVSAEEYNEALKTQRGLLRELEDLGTKRKDKVLALKEAQDSLAEAEKRLHEIEADPKHTKQERESAQTAVERARLSREEASRAVRRVSGEVQEGAESKGDEVKASQKKLAERVQFLKDRIKAERKVEQDAEREREAAAQTPGGANLQGEEAAERKHQAAVEKRVARERELSTTIAKNNELDKASEVAQGAATKAVRAGAEEVEKAREARIHHIAKLEDEIDGLKKLQKQGDRSAETTGHLRTKTEELSKAQEENKKADKEAASGLRGYQSSAESAGSAAGAALEGTERALNAALQALGIKPVKFTTAAGNIGKAVVKGLEGFAGGGWMGHRGQVGPDNKLVVMADGEGVLNRHHVPYADDAMAIAHQATGGAFPFASLDHMFASVKTPHMASGGMVPEWRGLQHFATGGMTRYQAIEREADRIAALKLPYVYGGGHGSTPAPASGPFDCSSSVSRVLQVAGYKIPTDTTPALLHDWNFPGGPGQVTVYAKGEPEAHTILKIGQRFWGTSGFGHPGFDGPGWFTVPPPASYLSQFTEVHPPGLGGEAGSIARLRKPVIKGPEGLFRRVAQAASNAAWKGADAYLAKAQPSSTGGGNAEIGGLPKGIKQLIGASTFGGPSDPGTGHMGYRGVNLDQHPDSFAELSRNPGALDFSALGGLAAGTRLWFGYGGKRKVLTKNDVGAGGGPVQGHPREADIWWKAAQALGFPEPGLGLVEVERASRGRKPATAKTATVHAKNRKAGHVDRGKRFALPAWIKGEKSIHERLSSLNRVEAAIKAEGERYNDQVAEYNRANQRSGNIVPKTTYDSQTANLLGIKRAIGSDYGSERSVSDELAGELQDAGGPHSPAAKRLHDTEGKLKRDEGLLGNLKATARKVKDAARRAAAKERKGQLAKRIQELRAENGKATPGKAPVPEHYDALGNKIPAKAGTPAGKPKDNTKAIHSAEAELHRADEAASAKDQQAHEQEVIRATEERIKTEKKREAELKKKVDAFTKLYEQVSGHKEAAEAGAHTTGEEIKDTETDQATTDAADESAAYDELTPAQQAEQERDELALSEAQATSTDPEAQANAEIKPAESLVAFAESVLAYRRGLPGAGDLSKPGVAKGLKDAEDMVVSARAQLAQLRTGATGGSESADAQAQKAQLETKASNLEALNQAARANLAAFSSTGDIGSGYGAAGATGPRSGAYQAAANPGEYGSAAPTPYAAQGSGAPSPFPAGHPLAGVPAGTPIIFQNFQHLTATDPAARAQVAGATVDALSSQNFTRQSRQEVL